MDVEGEIDQAEAAAAKELAVRIVLAVIFIALAYMGLAGAFERTLPARTDAVQDGATR